MARKAPKKTDPQDTGGASAEAPSDEQLAGAVGASAQRIWQAGLGAFAKAQGEGGKVFESLVREGISLQRRTQAAAEERFGEVGSRMLRLSDEVQSRAGQHWDRLEAIFEKRVAQALGRLGVPSSQDLEALGARLDALSAQVATLSKAASAARPAATRKAAPPAVSAGRPAAAKTGAGAKQSAAPKRGAAQSIAASGTSAAPTAARRKPPAAKRGA